MGQGTRSRIYRNSLAAGLFASAAAFAAPASAQGIALQRFEPSFTGDWFFGVQAPYTDGHNQLLAELLVDYAHNPLVAHDAADNTLGAIVGSQTLLHVHASYALWHRLTLDVDLPIGIQQGDQPTPSGGLPIASPTGGALGDIRVGARITLAGAPDSPFQLAIGGLLWTPSGSRAAFLSDGDTRGEPEIIVGGAGKYVVYSANLGAEIRPAASYVNVTTGSSFNWGAALAFRPGDGDFQIGPELTGSDPFKNPVRGTSDVEALLGARIRFVHTLVAGIGAGGGLSKAYGSPDFRTVVSLAYAPAPFEPVRDRDGDGILDDVDACPDVAGVPSSDPHLNGCPPPPDRDGDGIPDAEDACPDEKGPADPDPKKNGCPPPADRDKDGIPDAVDACPDVPGVKSDDPKKNGCPSDRDGDGIPDAQDACPDAPGPANPDPKKNGCPGDRDGDGITDDKDACPDERGPADPDPTKNGCPKQVRVSEDHIVLLEQVEFDTNQATIRKSSDGLLATITDVLKQHPEIKKVEVQGHTDDTGNARANLSLSQRRADAVVKALVKRGIDAKRMISKGYGQTAPIAPNVTPEGRQKNRRVEIKILEKAPKGS